GGCNPTWPGTRSRGSAQATAPGTGVESIVPSARWWRHTRIFLERRVWLPRLYMAWLTPAMFAPGDAELDLGTDLLANGKTSRLYRRLVFDERISADVSAAPNSREIARYAQITATPAPGPAPREIARAVL